MTALVLSPIELAASVASGRLSEFLSCWVSLSCRSEKLHRDTFETSSETTLCVSQHNR